MTTPKHRRATTTTMPSVFDVCAKCTTRARTMKRRHRWVKTLGVLFCSKCKHSSQDVREKFAHSYLAQGDNGDGEGDSDDDDGGDGSGAAAAAAAVRSSDVDENDDGVDEQPLSSSPGDDNADVPMDDRQEC
jgi:hypothetical protein